MDRKQIEPFENWAGPLGYVLAKVSAMPDENPYANSYTWKAYEAWCAAADLLTADGWVKVSERLPEPDVAVLLFVDHPSRGRFMQSGYWFSRPDCNMYEIGGTSGLYAWKYATHWRPLPPEPDRAKNSLPGRPISERPGAFDEDSDHGT